MAVPGLAPAISGSGKRVLSSSGEMSWLEHPQIRPWMQNLIAALQLSPRTRAKPERLPTSRAGGLGREVRRRTSGRRGSGRSPSCYPSPGPNDLRGTSDIPGRVRVGLRRRLPRPIRRALHRRSLRELMLRGAKCSSHLRCTRLISEQNRVNLVVT